MLLLHGKAERWKTCCLNSVFFLRLVVTWSVESNEYIYDYTCFSHEPFFQLSQLLNPLDQPVQPTIFPIGQQDLHHTRPIQKD
jgi:hypothetical protein